MEKNKCELIDSYFCHHQGKSGAIKSRQSCSPSTAVLAVVFAGMLLETETASAWTFNTPEYLPPPTRWPSSWYSSSSSSWSSSSSSSSSCSPSSSLCG